MGRGITWAGLAVLGSGLGWGATRLSAPAQSLAWSGDGRYVAAGVPGNALRVDLRGRGKPIAADGIDNVHLSPDGELALGVRGNSFLSVDLESGKVDETPVPEAQGKPVSWLRGAFGDLIVTRTLSHYQIRRSGGRSTDPDAAPTRNFRDVWLDPTEPLAYLDTTFGLEVRHLGSGLTLRTFDAGLTGQRYLGAVRDPDGRLIALLIDGEGLRVWTPPNPPGSAWVGIDPTRPISLSGDGRLVAVGDADRITLYRTRDRGQHAVLKVPAAVVRVAFSPDGTHVAAGLVDGTVRIFPTSSDGLPLPLERAVSAADPGRLRSGVLPLDPVSPVEARSRFSLSGATAHLGWTPSGALCGWVDGHLVEIDPTTGAERPLAVPGLDPGAPFAWSSDGDHLAGPTARGVALFDPARSRLVRLLPTGGDHHQLAWRRDVLVVDTEPAGSAQSWNAQLGLPLGNPFVASVDAVSRFELSPDGEWLAVTGRTARVVSSTSGEVRHPLDAQWGGVVAAAWSPDGAHLATSGGDGTVLVWDASTWTPTALVEGATGQQLVFSPDGTELLAASWDGASVAGIADGAVHRRLAFSGLLASADWSTHGIALVDMAGNLFLWP